MPRPPVASIDVRRCIEGANVIWEKEARHGDVWPRKTKCMACCSMQETERQRRNADSGRQGGSEACIVARRGQRRLGIGGETIGDVKFGPDCARRTPRPASREGASGSSKIAQAAVRTCHAEQRAACPCVGGWWVVGDG